MIKRRIQSEDGKAITIMGISLIVLVLLMGIFIVDFSKAVYIKNLYSSFALKAAQTAVKKTRCYWRFKTWSRWNIN